ncbi:D-alanyl-D-alanine carboxypeptidase family protein [Carnimonas bestiolae]|uniref:D-alanyl-D-alanine carboxypeptidase family protein n=1 Tax=Carnimonas bestiolae TaxID=3402172 RepID=UPI003EDBB63E
MLPAVVSVLSRLFRAAGVRCKGAVALVSVAVISAHAITAQALPAPQGVASPAWMLVDGESGQVLAEHNADDQRAIASLTKLMTTLVVYRALESGKLHWDDQVTIPDEVSQLGSDTSRMFVRPGTQVSVDTLMRGLIIVSANDAAMSLAVAEAGSLDGFVQQMNDTAASLGMTNTHFENVDGLTQSGHYSTARDLAKLAQQVAQEYPGYFKLSSLPDFRFGPFHGYATNRLVRTNPAIDGMKTGYTHAAGSCVIASEHRPDGRGNERRLYAIVLGAANHQQRFTDASTLLDYGYNNFYDVHLGSAGVPMGEFPLWKGASSNVGVTPNQDIVLSMPNDVPVNSLKAALVANKSPLMAPLNAGDEIGEYRVTLGDHTISHGPLFAAEPVEQENIVSRAIDSVRLAFGGTKEKTQVPLDVQSLAI